MYVPSKSPLCDRKTYPYDRSAISISNIYFSFQYYFNPSRGRTRTVTSSQILTAAFKNEEILASLRHPFSHFRLLDVVAFSRAIYLFISSTTAYTTYMHYTHVFHTLYRSLTLVVHVQSAKDRGRYQRRREICKQR